jgi:hypothetical protein
MFTPPSPTVHPEIGDHPRLGMRLGEGCATIAAEPLHVVRPLEVDES